jgi:hypothetical protein
MTNYFEKQYSVLDESKEKNGLVTLGPMASFTWNNDPRRLLFVLSRYKFAARMLEGCDDVIEIGCGDGFGSRIVRQHVKSLLLTDVDPLMLEFASLSSSTDFPVSTLCHNFAFSGIEGVGLFDGAYMLDVLEHISLDDEPSFFLNLTSVLTDYAKVVIGMPSIESQAFASPGSKSGHVNCKTKEVLGDTLEAYFRSVSLFSMNDEVVHTGFARMANYIIAVCSGPKR